MKGTPSTPLLDEWCNDFETLMKKYEGRLIITGLVHEIRNGNMDEYCKFNLSGNHPILSRQLVCIVHDAIHDDGEEPTQPTGKPQCH